MSSFFPSSVANSDNCKQIFAIFYIYLCAKISFNTSYKRAWCWNLSVLASKSYLEETMALKKFVVPGIQVGHFVETFPLLDAIMHIQNDNYQEINFLSIRFTVGNLQKINQNQKTSWDCNPHSTHSLYMK